MAGLMNVPLVRKWLLPGFIFLGIFLVISYGCGGGGGGSSILLPPHATNGTITGRVLSDGTIVFANTLSTATPLLDPALRENAGISNAEIWIEDRPEIRALSGIDGVFALVNVPFGNLRVVARLESALRTYLVRSGPVTINEVSPTGNAGELRVIEAINRVQGILRDRNANPVPNAVLSLWGITFRTDSDGRFVSPPLPADETSADIKVISAPGMQAKTITTPFLTGYVPELEIVLTPTGETQNAPVAFLTASATVISPNQQIQLYASVKDPDDSNLNNFSVDWSVTDGSLATGSNRWIANWSAPDRQINATATIVVTDISGLKGIARLPLKVGAGTQPGNQRPVVSNVTVAGTSGDIAITYKLADADNDLASISVYFSLDGGENFAAASSLIGSTTGVVPGEGRALTWRSAADITDEQSAVVLKITPADQGGTGTSAVSAAFTVNNTSVNSPPVVTAITTGDSSGNIVLSFKLSDAESDACSIAVAYSTDGGVNFVPVSSLIGSTTGLLPAENLQITWQSASDISDEQTNVVIKITPSDQGGQGTFAVSSAFTVNNTSVNAPPVISNVVAAGNAGDILLSFALSDAENDSCSLLAYYSIDGGNSFTQTQNLTGSTTGLLPGNALSIVWNSAADISGTQSNVKVRLVANDGQNTGTAGLTAAFAISNNALPTVSNVVAAGSSGDITLTFNLADPENDPCALEVSVSTDGGTTYQQTTALVGSLSNVLPGNGLTLTWDSRADLPSNQSNVRIKIVPNDGTASGTPGESAVFSVNNNTLPVVSNVAAAGSSGDILLTFNLADAENNPCSIALAYSIDGGSSFSPISSLIGTSSAVTPGINKTVIWNSAADIVGNQNSVKVRITPNDGIGTGTAGVSATFAVSNNNLPTVSAVTTSGTSGNIQLTYTLADPNNDVCSVTVYYSTDGGSNYLQTTNLTGTTINLTPGASKTLTWNSAADFKSNSSSVKVKIIPNDGSGNGVPGESAAFAINNNTPPVASNVTVSGSGGNLTITYDLADADSHNCSVALYYSVNGGTSYVATTNVTGTTTGIAPGTGKNLVWNSTADITGLQSSVKVRILPNDGYADGSAGESAVFTVNNNDLPVVSNVVTSGSSGNISITYSLADANSDPCSISVAYSIDNGVTYSDTSNITGTVTGVSPGTNKTLVWNSSADVPANAASVKIRISPHDGKEAGVAGESQAFAVNNNQIPVITSVAASGNSGDVVITYTLTDGNNDACSITAFYSIDGGVTYLQTGNLVGSTTGIVPGTNRSITWNSASDISANQTSVRFKLLPNDGYVNGTEGQSSVFAVNNNNLPVVSNVTTAGSSGNITITYNLSDANGDNCSITVYFSTDNGVSYTQTNNLTGTTANIPPGNGKTIAWNSALDVTGNQAQVKVKVIPRDVSGSGSAGESAAFSISNNNAPIISAVNASGNSGSILLTYTLADAESDACSVAVAYSTNGGTSYTTTTNVSGTVAGVVPGTGRTLSWLSDQDLPSDQASVRVKLTPNDGFSTGTAGESQVFTLSNSNQPPAVSAVTTTNTTGDIVIGYTLSDPNNDPCSIEVYYSTNAGGSYVKTTNITGKTTELIPGTGQSIIWNSNSDISGSLGNIRVRVVPIDRGGSGTAGDSATFAINNTGRPTVSSVTTSGGRGNITITYNLSDPESNPCSLYVYYSLDDGANYTRTTQLTGQTTGIAPGNGKTIVWNSSADINGTFATVRVKVAATDGTGFGVPGTSSAFAIANDGMPSVLRIVNTGSTGQILLSYDLLDPNGDLCSIEVYYSTDNGLNYTKTTNLMSGLIQDIIPGSGKSITWNSTADLMGSYLSTKIKIVPSDPAGAGIPGESMAFQLRNNRLPIISSLSTSGNSGDIAVSYTLSDEDSDPCGVAVEYSTDNGVNWFPTYNITGSLSNVSPGAGRTFTWHSADDFLSTHSQVRLRLTPNDGVGNGTPGMSSSFAVANNSLPAVANVTTSGNSGSVTISYDLSDAENNPCSVSLHYSLNGGVSYTQSTFISGQTTNVIPGAGQTIVWESSNNVTTNVSDVRVRLVPNDGTGNGTAGVSPSFALNNDTNSAPAITALSRSGTSGNITFTYTLSDANNDACAINLYYSTDGGSTYYLSQDISGAISGVLPGAGRTLVWDSVADVNSTIAGVLVKLVPQDSRSEGTSMTTAAFNISNNSLPSISLVTVTADSGPIPISYTLTDSNSDSCNVTVYYSTDGGLTFTQTTNVSGTLVGVVPGSNRSLIWNSGADINGNQAGVRIRLIPADPFGAGGPGETSSFAVNNNQLPIVSSVTTTGNAGDIVLTYNLADANTHNCSIEVYYSIDGGTSWLLTSDVTGTTTGIAPGNGKTITWNSAANINRNQSNVRARVVPTDPFGTGTGGNSSSITVLNNLAPVVSSVTPASTNGSIVVTYNLADGNDNPCSILFYYSTNGGTSYVLSNNIAGVTSNILPGNDKIITWNSTADINTDNTTVRVRIVANDGAINGAPGDSATFSILNNRAPVVSSVTTSGNTGDIGLTYNITDENGDSMSIALAYSTDNWSTSNPINAANITGATSGITSGNSRSVTWNSAADIVGDSPNVKVRITPNDGLINGTAGDSASFAVGNNNLPVVSNVVAAGTSGNINISYNLADSNGDNCSIQVYYSIDGGSSYLETTNLTGDISGIVPGAGKTISWNSALDIPGAATQVRVKILPNDGTGTGNPGESSVFGITNNSLPTISNVTTSVTGSDVTISYQLADNESDNCSIEVYYSIDAGITFTRTMALTGAQAGIAVGNRSIIWNSITDFRSNSGNVRVKVIPNDGKGTGTAGVSGSFALSNNSLPTVSIASVAGTSGAITINYDLADVDQNACSIEVYYSTNGGLSYTRTTSLTGQTSNVSPATGRTITWNSGDDFTGKSTTVYVRVVANDGFGNGVAGVNGAFTVNNNVVPVVSSLAAAGSSGNIALTFTLADANNHSCDLSVDYSIDGGISWASATGITGTLVGVVPGSGKTLTWDSRQNFTSNQANVKTRITPRDPYEGGTSGQSNVFAINNNRLPSISSVVVSGATGDVSITYNVADEDNDVCSVSAFYSIDGGAFTAINVGNLTGTVSGITPGDSKTLVWKSAADVNTNKSNVRLRLTPHDGISNGTSGESIIFALNNNQLPAISNVTANLAGAVATIRYTLSDLNNDNCNVAVQYSIDSGTTWSSATSVIGALNNVAPGADLEITWTTSSNLPGRYSNVSVKLTPSDFTGNGSPGQSAGFVVDNNNAPVLANIVIAGSAGPIDLTYDLTDADGDSCNIGVEYSLDGGTSWSTATGLSGHTSVSPGTSKTTIWNSSGNFASYQNNVKVRLTANDSYVNSNQLLSGVFTVDNNTPPEILNVRVEGPDGDSKFTITYDLDDINDAFCNVSLWYSTDDGGNWTLSQDPGETLSVPRGVDQQLIWNPLELPPPTQYRTLLQLRPYDGFATGTAGTTPVFFVNNFAPTLSNLTLTSDGATYYGEMKINLTIDDDSENNSVFVEYTINNGSSWLKPTLREPTTGLSAGTHSFSWESYHDAPGGSSANQSRVRAQCFDGQATSTYVYSSTPASFTLANSHIPPTTVNFTEIDCGLGVAAAVGSDGLLYVWGWNTSTTNHSSTAGYYYGRGAQTTYTNAPTMATQPRWSGLKDVACTYNGILVLRNDGTIDFVGYHAASQGLFGNNVTVAAHYQCVTVPTANPMTNVTKISAGPLHVMALKDDYTVWTWGMNTQGAIGDGTTAVRYLPYQVEGLTGIIDISAGGYATSQTAGVFYSLALRADGSVWAWGANANGQLGLGYTSTSVPTPTRIPGLSNIVQISAGGQTSLFLSGDGKLYSCGYGAAGALGNNTTTANQSTPVEVSLPAELQGRIKKIYAGSNGANLTNCFAVDLDGRVWAWGANTTSGPLGVGNIVNQLVPTKVLGLARIGTLATGKAPGAYPWTVFCSDDPSAAGVWTCGSTIYAVSYGYYSYNLGNTTGSFATPWH